MPNSDLFDRRLRRFLLGLSGLALVTTLIELWLQDHTQELLQWLPWALCGLGLLSLLFALVRPNRLSLYILRGVMLLVGLGSLTGIIIHLLRNIEFQQDIHPTQTLNDFFVAALKGAAPLLAPGALLFAALLALAATYHHPALQTASTHEEPANTLLNG